MPIDVTCPKCSRAYKLKDELAGKRLKCVADGCGNVLLVPAIEPPKKSLLGGFQLPTLIRPRSAEDLKAAAEAKAAALAAKEAKIAAKRAAWKRFWFQVKLTVAIVFFSAVGLLGWAVYVTKDAPRVNYVSNVMAPTPQNIPSTPEPPRKDQTDPAKQPKPKSDDGRFHESKLEKAKEWWTGKEIVHKKDGTTYERDKPKK